MKHREPGEPLTLSYMPSSTVEPVISVKESDSLRRAVTLMELNDFSQLPVVRGAGKHPKGVVTWETIGRALAVNPDATLKDCIDSNPPTSCIDHDLMHAIEKINRAGYTLVLKQNKELSGIVTSADLGTALAQITSPFLLLEQLEDRLSRIVRRLQSLGMVSRSDLQPTETKDVEVNSARVDDLPLGDKITLATRKETWHCVTSAYDRSAVATSLEGAARLRNRLMHFRQLESSDSHALASLPSLVATLTRIATAMPDDSSMNA